MSPALHVGDEVSLQGDDGTTILGHVVEVSPEGSVRVEWRSGPCVLRGVWGPSGQCAGAVLVGFQGATLARLEREAAA